MSTTLSVIILIEVLFTLFIAWGLMHEERFVAFEDKIIFAVLRKIRSTKAKRECARYLAALNSKENDFIYGGK